MSLSSQIQAVLDSFGIHLDTDSFNNLLIHLRVSSLGWSQKMAVSIALGVLVQFLRKKSNEAQQLATAQAEA